MYNDESANNFYQKETSLSESDIPPTENTSSNESNSSRPKIQPVKQIASLVVVALIAGSSFFMAQRLTTPVATPTNSQAQVINPVRIMNVYYLPTTSPWTSKLADVFKLSLSLKTYLGFASSYHHDTTKQVASIEEIGQPYLRYIPRPIGVDPDPFNAKFKTYQAILTDTRDGKSICQLVQELNLDQVWLWVDTNVDKAPGSEYIIVNPTSNYGNPLYSNICGNNKSFVIMGLAYNSPIQNAMHSFGHYMEALLENIQGRDLFVGRYEGAAYAGTLNNVYISEPISPYVMSEKCGNVHTPPNIPLDAANHYAGYIYNGSQTVLSTCDYWTPDGTGTKVAASVDTWLNIKLPSTAMDSFLPSPELSFLTWWMQNMPTASLGLKYNGQTIPTWWEFVSDTDNKIRTFINNNYWMSPDLSTPVDATKTAFCTNESGISSNCTYTPGSSTLGASTENDQVLATTTYADIAVVTVGYGHASVQVSSVTYCGQLMTRVGDGPANGGGMKTYMWFKTAPKSGVCPVVVKFTTDPGQRIVSTTIFNNIDQVTPITGTIMGGFSGPYTGTQGTISATLAGPKDSLMVCGISYYSEQTTPPTPNYATPNKGTTQLWKFEQGAYSTGTTINNWAALGAGVQRANANQSTTLAWTTKKQQPSSYNCVNFNVKPMPILASPAPTTPTPVATPVPLPTATPAPTPTPRPSVTPTATPAPVSGPTVDIKANGLDRLYQPGKTGQVTLTWKSTNATSCKGLVKWTGAKTLTGTATVTAPITGTSNYVVQCTGPTGLVSYDQVYVYPLTYLSSLNSRSSIGATTFVGKMFVNGFDNTPPPVGSGMANLGTPPKVPFAKGLSPTFTWVTNASACYSSWTVPVGASGTYVMAPITANTTYSIACGLSGSSAPIQLSATAYVK